MHSNQQVLGAGTRMRGVTLIELLTVMVVLGILSTVAVSSYRNYLMRTNRVDGRQLLLRIQVGEQKYFLQNNTYTADLVSATNAGGLGLGNTSPGGYYTMAVVPGNTGTIATSFSASATAISTQTNDTLTCQTMSIDDLGAKTPAESTGCWK
jgi:type IV pilus assembly protein PilE